MDLNDLMGLIMGAKENQYENEKDPFKFPRHVEITDPSVLDSISRCEQMLHIMEEQINELRALSIEREAIKTRLFVKLYKLHPNISISSESTQRYIQFADKWYFVSFE